MNQIQLFIIDDHKIVRDGLKALLIGRPAIKVCGEAVSVREATEKLAVIEPDMLFVDLKLPDGNGSEFVTNYLKDRPNVKAALLTAEPNKMDLKRAEAAGVCAFLTKDIDQQEYYIAIDKMLSGKKHVSAAFADVLMNDSATLTPREFDVLQGFADGLTYKEIGAKLKISARTVETHKNHLLDKFQVKSIVEMVRLAIREGYLEP
ncbi:MAG: response regulator transcription factor [Bacteroidota bacterium]